MRSAQAERRAGRDLQQGAADGRSFEQRWSVWAAGYRRLADHRRQCRGSDPTTPPAASFGTAVGADYRFSPDTLAGFALAGGGTNFTVANGGSGRSDLFQAGAFIRHNAGAAYLSAALAYGWQDITTDRTVTVAGIDRLRAKFNANAFSGRVEGGYRFVTPGWAGRHHALRRRPVHHLRSAGLCRAGVSSAPTPLRSATPPRASPRRAANSAFAPTNPAR